jgi:signal transduction histidine kinase/ActR/RegA family two-component response regulator
VRFAMLSDGDADGATRAPLATPFARATLGLLIVIMFVLGGAAAYTWILISKRDAVARELSGYNAGHSFSQAALEFARLQAAVGAHAVRQSDSSQDAVLRWVDIVLGRVELLESGTTGSFLRSEPELVEIAVELRATANEAQRIAGRLDEDGAVERLMTLLARLNPQMTRLAALAHVRGGDLTTREMEDLAALHTTFSAVLMGLVASAFVLTGMLIWSNALLRRSYRETHRLLENLRQVNAALTTAHERLARTQRMEALGRLAGGIAHDFNNVLQAVLSGAKLLVRRAGDRDATQRLSTIIIEAAERGASVTRRLLALGRQNSLHPQRLQASALLLSLREVLSHTLGGTVDVRVEAPADLPPFLADRSQLEIVLVNLAINARDAMAERGGVITLAASLDEVPPVARRPAGLAPGAYVRLAVADTGCGMDQLTLQRVTEPFFTTKPAGKGTGLGLAMARGFAEQSGGGMHIDSELGHGTTVTLWLPRVPQSQEVDEGNLDEGDTPKSPGTLQQERCILLVDDELHVRTLLAEGLRERGFRVEESDSGVSALELLDRHGKFHAVITDLAMPGMDGLELLRNAHARWPGLPVILLTGYVDDASVDDLTKARRLTIVRKPVSVDDLVSQLTALLHPDAQGASA